jgi:hypothetical protein
MDVTHAVVELALFSGAQGSASRSFAVDGWNLFHGNQMLAGKVTGYDPARRFRQSDHSLANHPRPCASGLDERPGPRVCHCVCVL